MEKNKFLIIIFCLLLPVVAFATEEVGFLNDGQFLDNRTQNQPRVQFESEGLDFKKFAYKFLLITAIVIISIIVGFVYLKKNKFDSLDSSIKVIETVNLSPGKSIVIVSIVDDFFVLGVTGSNINVLTKIEDKYTKEEIKKNHNTKVSSFKELLLLSSLDTLAGKEENNK